MKELLTFLTITWLLGFLLFLSITPKSYIDSNSKADAVIVLTGGFGRVRLGLDLLRQGFSDRMFISGVNTITNLKSIIKDIDYNIDTKKIELGYAAQNTAQNAKESAEWLQNNKIKSAYLVTSKYHITRSFIHFISFVAKDVKLMPYYQKSSLNAKDMPIFFK